ncbi:PAS domain S-box protein [Azoarcus sp. L1K30]|uniref:sensor domain-containing diguanylate cyclase n=1 Tax=Azoarcus sp. L1K30 TaxID=2820277 RepID=UPI001B8293CA|nr:PAS domain S-box protein [Azoarcus sp. L1K30]MBR0567016.1 PAS domain S-box protein [Azoarcus sp. L1K30]
MTLYLIATLLACSTALLVLGDGSNTSPLLWMLTMIPLLTWIVLRQGGRHRGSSPTTDALSALQSLSRFAEHSSQPALLLDGENIANANRALLRLIGLEDRGDELIGMPIDNIVHPKHHRRLAALFSPGADNSDAGTLSLMRADGTPWPARVSVFQGHRSQLTLLQFSAPQNGPDNNGHEHLQATRLTHFSREILFSLDAQLQLSYANAQWQRSTGRSVAESAQQPFLSTFHSEDRAALGTGLRQLQAGKRDGLTLEVRIRATRAHAARWVELRACPMPLPALGETGVSGILLDIDQRRRSEEALRAQRRGLHTMLDNLPGMIYRGQNDRNWTMEFVSEGCFELTGYTPLELVDNHSACFAEMIHEEDRDFVWNFVQMRLDRRERYELSYRIVDRDGQTRWVWEQGRGIYSSRGEFLGLEGFITDVSASRGAQEEARRRLFFDNATGLLSLSLFLDRLQHLHRHAAIADYPFALIHIEIATIAEIAERYGPAMSERVSVEIGKRLQIAQNDCNGVARHAGGFAVLISDFRPQTLGWAGPPSAEPASEAGLLHLAHALSAVISRPLRIDGHNLSLSARFGIASDREAYADAHAMLEQAARHDHPGALTPA